MRYDREKLTEALLNPLKEAMYVPGIQILGTQEHEADHESYSDNNSALKIKRCSDAHRLDVCSYEEYLLEETQ